MPPKRNNKGKKPAQKKASAAKPAAKSAAPSKKGTTATATAAASSKKKGPAPPSSEDDDDEEEGPSKAQMQAMLMSLFANAQGGGAQGKGGKKGGGPSQEAMLMEMMMRMSMMRGMMGGDDEEEDEEYDDFSDEEDGFCSECGEDEDSCECGWMMAEDADKYERLYGRGRGDDDSDDEDDEYTDTDGDADADGADSKKNAKPILIGGRALQTSSHVEEIDSDDDGTTPATTVPPTAAKSSATHVDPTAMPDDDDEEEFEDEEDDEVTPSKGIKTAAELIPTLGASPAQRRVPAYTPVKKRAFLKEILAAIEEDDTDGLKALIAKKADINAKDKNRKATPLHFACFYNRLEAVGALIMAGARLNAMDEEGITPLACCAQSDRTEAAKVLLWAGADIEFGPDYEYYARDNNHCFISVDYTPLHYGAEAGCAAMCQLLLDHGANVNAKAEYDDTPLMLAAEGGHTSTVKVLLKAKGIKLEAVGGRFDRGTALGRATKRKRTAVIKLLKEAGARSAAFKETNGLREDF